MGDSASRWLKRALGVVSLVAVSSVFGCGSDPRTFASDPTQDASPDTSKPESDGSTGMDVVPDVSMGTDTGLDSPPTDARDADALAGDAARDGGGDARSDVVADVGASDTSDVTMSDVDLADVPIDNTNLPPTIVSSVPADMAMTVPVSATITVDFSKPMNPATVAVILNPAATLGSAIWNTGNTSISFTPPSPLQSKTSFTATVTGTDTGGRALSGATSFSFTTGEPPDTTAPAIRATVPANNATNVPAGTNVIITFTEPMDIGSVVVTSVPDIMLGMPTWNTTNDQISFTPTTALLAYTEYTVTVAGQDVVKNPLAPSTTFKFTTAQPPDTTPPTVVSIAPPNGAVSVPNNSSIVITFSEAMNVALTTSALSIGPAIVCNGGWSWNVAGTTATCVPNPTLAYMTTYTVGVGVGAKDVAGNSLASAFSSSFTTGVMPDTTPPTIVSVIPSNGAAGIPRSAAIVVTFSEAMDINTAQAAFSVTAPAGVTGTFSWASGNTQMGFTPTALFAYDTTVTWQVSTAAKDASGNAKTTTDTFSFNVIKSATVSLPCVPALDGYTFVNATPNVQTAATYIAVGWYSGTTLVYRGYETFDMSLIPANATAITAATMYFEQYQISGTTYGATALGSLLWRHVDFGPTLEAADNTVTQLPHSASSGTLSSDATLGWKAATVTLSLRDDLANRVARGNRSEFLLRFTNDSDALNLNGEWSWLYSCDTTVATDKPYVVVTYEYP